MPFESVSNVLCRLSTDFNRTYQRLALVITINIVLIYAVSQLLNTNGIYNVGGAAGHVFARPLHSEKAQSSRVAKVTMSYGDSLPAIYQRILQGHQQHADRHGYRQFVLRQQILPRSFSKQAYLLSIMLQEYAKPAEERLEWLFWFDNDAVVMNQNIPLEIFLPPAEDFPDVNLLVSTDHKGLNAGVFFIRVNEWAIQYLSDVIAMPTYQPNLKLRFGEQSAMASLIESVETYGNSTVFVPQRWFNAYRGNRDLITQELTPHAKQKSNTIKPGDMLLHFAGTGAKLHLEKFVQMSEAQLDEWNKPLAQTGLQKETTSFWKRVFEQQQKKRASAS